MEKAYDLKALGALIVAKAKAKGLTVAEEALEDLGEAVYFGTKEWATESAALSATKIDDFIAPFYGYLDSVVVAQIEKVDLDGDGK